MKDLFIGIVEEVIGIEVADVYCGLENNDLWADPAAAATTYTILL